MVLSRNEAKRYHKFVTRIMPGVTKRNQAALAFGLLCASSQRSSASNWIGL